MEASDKANARPNLKLHIYKVYTHVAPAYCNRNTRSSLSLSLALALSLLCLCASAHSSDFVPTLKARAEIRFHREISILREEREIEEERELAREERNETARGWMRRRRREGGKEGGDRESKEEEVRSVPTASGLSLCARVRLRLSQRDFPLIMLNTIPNIS